MMTAFLEAILDQPTISRIRRNHGLEHATIHILSKKFPKRSMAGHSDAGGFWLIGDFVTGEVEAAVDQALARLRAGESELAVHPNCGTNLVTAGAAAGLAGALAMFGAGRRWRDKFERLPLAMTLATMALVLARPLGFLLQEQVTTSGEPGGLTVVEIVASQRGQFKTHRVVTRG